MKGKKKKESAISRQMDAAKKNECARELWDTTIFLFSLSLIKVLARDLTTILNEQFTPWMGTGQNNRILQMWYSEKFSQK